MIENYIWEDDKTNTKRAMSICRYDRGEGRVSIEVCFYDDLGRYDGGLDELGIKDLEEIAAGIIEVLRELRAEVHES